MGISGFAKFIEETFPGSIETTQIRKLDVGGRIAVDGNNEAYVQMHVSKTSFVKNMTQEQIMEYVSNPESRDKFTQQIRKIWISRLIDFVVTDLKKNIVWVMDGSNTPKLKEEIRAERREKSEKATSSLNASMEELNNDDFPNPMKYRKVVEDYITSQPPVTDDYLSLITVFVNIGIPVVRAWGEGEKACARLCNHQLTDNPAIQCAAVWSADVDSLLFGAPIMIQRKKSYIGKNTMDRSESGQVRIFRLSNIPITIDKLVRVCVAHGCDYLPKGIPGLGLKKAYKLYCLTDNPPEFPAEYLNIVNMFRHEESEAGKMYTKDELTSRLSDPIVSWFINIYG